MSEESTLSERIEVVEEAEAEGEQLVSVAVPPGESVGEMRERVEEDRAERLRESFDGVGAMLRAPIE